MNTVREAIEEIKKGNMVVVTDNENRENEGDLIMAAELATSQTINFMASHAKGLICAPMEERLLKKLGIPPMVENNTDNHETAFAVSIDHKDTTTGISAYERAYTISKMLDQDSKPSDFRRPGHVFPLAARKGGVLKRAGHTEAAVDLAKLAGLKGAGVICEIMNDDGTMARTPELIQYCRKYKLKMITVADLIHYKMRTEQLVEKGAEAKLPTIYGNFTIHGYTDIFSGKQHVALVMGDISDDTSPVLVRLHSQCLTGDTFDSLRCDCGNQLKTAMKRIASEGRGVLIYMEQEGRGIGLINKLSTYALQDNGMDTVEANIALGFPPDIRNYAAGAQILSDLGVKRVKLMTNNPQKIQGLAECGIEITQRIPLEVEHSQEAENYLKVKKQKMGHLLHV